MAKFFTSFESNIPLSLLFFFTPLPEIHKSLRHLPRQTHCRQKSSLLPLSPVCFCGLIYLAIIRGAFSPSWKEVSVNTLQQRAFCSSSTVERASWRESYLYICTTWWRYWVTWSLCPCPLQNLLIPSKTFFTFNTLVSASPLCRSHWVSVDYVLVIWQLVDRWGRGWRRGLTPWWFAHLEKRHKEEQQADVRRSSKWLLRRRIKFFYKLLFNLP